MMIFSQESLPSSTAVLSTVASLTASAVLLRTMAADLLPVEFHDYFFSSFRKLTKCLFSSQLTVVIEEFEGLTPNHMFESANVYLGTKISPSTHRIKVNKPEKDEELAITVDKNQEIFDFYQGVSFKWVLFLQSSSTTAIKQSGNYGNRGEANPRQQDLRFFELRFHRKHKEMALKTYLRYILREANAIKEERKALKLHTVDYNGIDYWGLVLLNHQATFDTMAMMDVEVKRDIIEDLDRFISRKEYYRRVGRAWKRGYLLYGPPGTGKSSLVAAMANYLKFDVYDLDLREVQCNSDLRRLLIGTKNRSILVIEDIDCNVGLLNRESGQNAEDDKITLSGLLNFVDGLWSSCGDERIIVFTTNHKDRLDPALLRPGRMDVHLHMSYCTFSGFKTLVYNYLKIQEHPLFGAAEELLVRVEVTPAEVAGELMRSDNAEIALQGLIKYLQSKENKTEVMQ